MNSVRSLLLLGIGLCVLQTMFMAGLPMFLSVTGLVDLGCDLPYQTLECFNTRQATYMGFLGVALATGQYLKSLRVWGVSVRGVMVVLLLSLGPPTTSSPYSFTSSLITTVRTPPPSQTWGS